MPFKYSVSLHMDDIKKIKVSIPSKEAREKILNQPQVVEIKANPKEKKRCLRIIFENPFPWE